MAQLVSDAANTTTYTAYNTKIPSLTDTSDIVEAFRLYHYGVENYTTNTSPSASSIYMHLKNLGDRASSLESDQSVVNPLLFMGA